MKKDEDMRAYPIRYVQKDKYTEQKVELDGLKEEQFVGILNYTLEYNYNLKKCTLDNKEYEVLVFVIGLHLDEGMNIFRAQGLVGRLGDMSLSYIGGILGKLYKKGYLTRRMIKTGAGMGRFDYRLRVGLDLSYWGAQEKKK